MLGCDLDMVHFSSCIGQNLAATWLRIWPLVPRQVLVLRMLSSWEGGKIGLGVASRLCTSGRVFLTFLVKTLSYALTILWPYYGRVPSPIVEREKLLRHVLHNPMCVCMCVHSLEEY